MSKLTKIGLPPGGSTGEVLKKKTGTNYDVEWGTGGGGGSGSVTSVATTAPITGGTITTTGTIGITQATTSTDGYLSSTDWNTFNGKQNALTNPVTGTGTTNELAYFTGSTTIASLATGTYPSLTELSYVKGVTSAIQTQLNGKQATLTNPVTGTGTTNYVPKFTGTSTIGNSTIQDLTSGVLVNPSVTASSAVARGIYHTPTLIAAANNDTLTAFQSSPTFTPGAFTGLVYEAFHYRASISGQTFVGRILNTSGTTNSAAQLLIQSNFHGTLFLTSSGIINTNSGLAITLSPNNNNVLINTTLAQSSGTTTSYFLRINGVINNTGTYSGTTFGIYYAPVLTSLTGTTHVAFENTTGLIRLNTTSGNTLIGTSTDNGAKLQVNGTSSFQNDITISDTRNIILNTTTGTKIGTATTQKLGFFNATPVVQPSSVTTSQGIADALTSLGLLSSSSITTTPDVGGKLYLFNSY